MNGIAKRLRRFGVLGLMLCTEACSPDADVEDIKQMVSRGDPILATTRVENGVTVYEHAADAFDKAPQIMDHRGHRGTEGFSNASDHHAFDAVT